MVGKDVWINIVGSTALAHLGEGLFPSLCLIAQRLTFFHPFSFKFQEKERFYPTLSLSSSAQIHRYKDGQINKGTFTLLNPSSKDQVCSQYEGLTVSFFFHFCCFFFWREKYNTAKYNIE